MNALERLACAAGSIAAITLFALISAEPVFAGSNNTSGTASPWSSATGLLGKAATGTAPTAPVIPPGTPMNVRDHRSPAGSGGASGGPPPAAAPGTMSAIPATNVRVPTDRDHRPGGNTDECLKKNNTCSAKDRENSIDEYRKRNPNIIGLDGDPCFQIKSCSERQLIESLIVRLEKNLVKGACDSRIKGQGCAQVFILPGGAKMTLHFQYSGGPLIDADKQRYLAALQVEYNRTATRTSGGRYDTGAPNYSRQ